MRTQKMATEAVTNGWASINGNARFDVLAEVNHKYLTIKLENNEGLSIYCFNASMFPIKSNRTQPEKYVFSGPKLGVYHDVIDIREGPYINHFIHTIEIKIQYCEDKAVLSLTGIADLSDSSYDKNDYKGPKEGEWKIECEFHHKFNYPKNS